MAEQIHQPGLEEIRDIMASAGMGTWYIEYPDSGEPRMTVDATMSRLMGIDCQSLTPEGTYTAWFSRIAPGSLPSVQMSVSRMMKGAKDENTYLWMHPEKGERYVRCGGTAKRTENGWLLSGYHYDVDSTVRTEITKRSLIDALASVFSNVFVLNLDTGSVTAIDTEAGIDAPERFSVRGPEFDRYINNVIHPEDREKFLSLRRPGSLSAMFDESEKPLLDFRTVVGGEIHYMQAQFVRFSPDSPEVVMGIRSIDGEMKEKLHITESQRRHAQIMSALENVYYSLYLIDIERDSFEEIYTIDSIKPFLDGITSAREAVLRMTDALPDTHLTRSLRLFMDIDTLQGRLASSSMISCDYVNINGNWARACYAPIERAEGGPVTKVLLGLQSIEKEAELLQTQNDLITALTSAYNDVYMVNTEDGSFASRRMSRDIYHLHRSDFTYGNYEDAISLYRNTDVMDDDKHLFDPIATIESCKRILAGRDSYAFEYRIQRDGEIHYHQALLAKLSSLRAHFVIAFKNVDKETQTRLAMAKAEREQLGIIRALSSEYESLLLLSTASARVRIIRTTRFGMDILRKNPSAGDALHALVEHFVAPEDQEEMFASCSIEAFDRDVPDTGIRSLNYRMVKPEGGYSYNQMNIARFTADDGARYFILAIRDVTSLMETEIATQEALRSAYETAEAASSAKSSFLRTMSHDVRTPLNGILGMAALAANHTDNPAKISDSLQKITAAGRHLLSLVNEVLDMSSIEAGRLDLFESRFTLPELIDSLLAIVRPQAEEHRHTLRVDICSIRHEDVLGDLARVQQVFVNLMGNAIKYTPDGGEITLTARELPSHRERTACFEFTVKDNGIGMTEEFARHIFEPFSRAHDSTIARIQGTGLGMTIARDIVRRMGGDIHVESRIGEGSTFVFTLFLKLPENSASAQCAFDGLRVLAADSSKASCDALRETLSAMGMRAETALTAEEAKQKIAEACGCGDPFFAAIIDSGLELESEDTRCISAGWGASSDASPLAHIEKPLFVSKLAKLFSGILHDMPAPSAPKPGAVPSLDGIKCLLAEDNDLNAEIATELLTMAGMRVERAADGKEAAEMILGSPEGAYDIVLMDIQMPVMNGYEAARLIRSKGTEYFNSLPIIAMTANAFADDIQASKASGMNSHIAKPIELAVLAKEILRLVNH